MTNKYEYKVTGPVQIKEFDNDGEVASYMLEDIDDASFDKLKKAIQNSDRELAPYIDSESPLKNIIESILIDINKTESVTKVVSNTKLTKEHIKLLEDEITGQFSDGWGEGFEQTEFDSYSDMVEVQNPDFDYDDDDSDEEETFEEYVTFHKHAHFWNYDNFELTTKLI